MKMPVSFIIVLLHVCVVAAMEPCVPPGFRFHPTDEELVGYYLQKKVAAQKIDMDIIREIDLRRIEPWNLQDSCRVGFEEQNEWYFFSHPEKKHTSGTRTNRATKTGFWKATGRDKAVYEKNRIIGKRKTLVFYKGRAPNGQKTEWIVHEYRLDSDVNELPTEEAWVVCRAFKKGANSQTRYTESSVSRYFHDEPAGVSSIKYITVQPQNLIFKQEREACRSLHILNSDNFIQLPLLESPTLPAVKRQSLMSLVPENIEDEHHKGCHNVQKGLEWRTLDKFVASQLCQEQ